MSLYVYALVDEKLPRRSIRGHRIEPISAGDIYAMAERRVSPLEISEQGLIEQHAIVVSLARQASAILPARFGSLLDEDELETIVSLRRQQLHDAFELVRGCEQMTVRLLGGHGQHGLHGGHGQHGQHGGSRDRAVASPASDGGTPGRSYLQRRRAEAGYPLPDAVPRVSAALRSIVRAEKAEPGQGAVRAVMYHLIRKGRRRAYLRAIDALVEDVAPMTLKVTGPWPPFAFAPELLG